MERISQSQMAALIIVFQIGSSPLYLLGKEAGTDAWISILIALVLGLLLLMLILLIHRLEPDKDLVEISNAYFGKTIGYVIGAVYFVYFVYQSVRNVRELGDLVSLYFLQTTPLWIVISMLLLIAGYAVWHGLEVFSRITQILAPIILLIYVGFFILVYTLGFIDLHRIEPVLENGLPKVIDAAFGVVSFPFGEMVLFLMFWKFVAPQKKVFPTTVLWYMVTGLFISLMNLIIIASLGPISEMSITPFIELMSQVRIESYLERLDPFVGAVFFAGVFIKMTAYFLGAVLVGKRMVKSGQRYIVVSIGVLLLIASLLFRSYMQHIRIGFSFDVKYHFPIYQFYIPLVLLLVMLIRRSMRAKKNGRS
ncbi:GerAB/ArcD/ProY family transporter [Paenibacillus pedocola]|uniref:GerAB/ArcD/ProY family transporter n=1 Tax=Paenibacillus pedocola TaxID=3242193 RepID=UPI00287753EC|nr:GerAB/ArcD/ProY family transporter [Paenibacillus typhae]